MQEAAERLARDLDALEFGPAAIPVIQNVNGEIASGPDEIKQNLLHQLHEPVLWVDCVRLMSKAGVKLIVECGPGKVLCGLIKRIDSEISCSGTDDPASLQRALEEVSE